MCRYLPYSRFYLVVFRGGDPDDEVGPEADETEEDGYQEEDADYSGVDVEVSGDAAADTGDAAVGGAAGEATVAVVVFHWSVFFTTT